MRCKPAPLPVNLLQVLALVGKVKAFDDARVGAGSRSF